MQKVDSVHLSAAFSVGWRNLQTADFFCQPEEVTWMSDNTFLPLETLSPDKQNAARKVSLSIGKTWNTCLFLVAHTDKWQIKGKKPEPLNPTERGLAVGPYSGDPLQINTKLCRNISLMMKYFSPDGSGLFHDDNIPNH